MTIRCWRVLFIALAVFAGSACGDDGPEGVNVQFVDSGNNKNNTNNMTDMDTSVDDMDMGDGTNNANSGCTDVVCDEGQKCVRGDCVPEDARLACDEIDDRGVLQINQNYTLVGDTTSFVDTLDTACVETVNGFSGAENAFKFQVSVDALTRLTLTSSATNVDWLMEVRTGGCEDGESTLCSDPEQTQFVARAGVDYYLVVEPKVGFDKGPFQIVMQFQEVTCSPGDRTCINDTVEVCGQGTYACAGGCDTGACGGDACANAIDVTASMSFSGDSQGYRSNFNFESETSCSPSMASGIATPGPDMVFRLPGLTVGQIVTIDTTMNDSNDNAIFILNDCTEPAQACLSGRDLGDTLTYTVETAGDHFVVVDKLSTSPKPFNYVIDIQ